MRQNLKWTPGYLSTKGQYAQPSENSLPVELTHCRMWNGRHCPYPFCTFPSLVEKTDVPGQRNTGTYLSHSQRRAIPDKVGHHHQLSIFTQASYFLDIRRLKYLRCSVPLDI